MRAHGVFWDHVEALMYIHRVFKVHRPATPSTRSDASPKGFNPQILPLKFL
jgi:hypothetical protein